MPMDRSRYPADWDAISKRIRQRDGNKCKTCGVANGVYVSRDGESRSFMLEDGRVFHEDTGVQRGWARGSEYEGGPAIKIVLTVAHLDHDPSNNADENLAALCQLHHLRLDAKQHAASARENRRAKLAVGELFDDLISKSSLGTPRARRLRELGALARPLTPAERREADRLVAEEFPPVAPRRRRPKR